MTRRAPKCAGVPNIGSLGLTRKVGESFRIGGDITIAITEISGSYVGITIQAPREVEVLRTEVVEREAAEEQRRKAVKW